MAAVALVIKPPTPILYTVASPLLFLFDEENNQNPILLPVFLAGQQASRQNEKKKIHSKNSSIDSVHVAFFAVDVAIVVIGCNGDYTPNSNVHHS